MPWLRGVSPDTTTASPGRTRDQRASLPSCLLLPSGEGGLLHDSVLLCHRHSDLTIRSRGKAGHMFGLFRRDSGGGAAAPSLDSIRFDTTGYDPQGEPQPGKVRVWHTPPGDGLGVFFFPVPPDLPKDAASVEELASFYRRALGDSGGRLVEVSVVVAGGVPAVRTLLSVPQQPGGRAYVGSLTVPFRDFSFVLKCQCAERGTTGVKEALLFARLPADGPPMQVEGERCHVPGWDPDDERHDAEFPDHPVARARRVLTRVVGSLTVGPEIRALPGFQLPR